MAPLSRNSYVLGIICALPEEKAAVEEMLDEEHDSLEQNPQDTNKYTFGKIGQHNVVVACLPGSQGKVCAATVAMHMKHSFPIKLGLMVGIGGGVPSQVPDIRLGDVVVSMPEGTHGGVVQYDLVKMELDGLRRKGHLNRPPQDLLSAVTALRTRHERKEPDFRRYLSRITQHRMMANKYGYQGVEHDRLFSTRAVHPDGHETCNQCISTLSTVERPARSDNEPQVFYGSIGSGDVVMKNGDQRDSRAAADKILCFEMEAAGLMNDFPCIVIRGISDYADSHKNDRWQPYAAATAAAYAKELLSVVNAQEVKMLGLAKKHVVPFSLKGIPSIDNFVTRDNDMQGIEAFFFPPRSSPLRRKIFVVHGMGGIGKTQLCIEFARIYHPRYDAVFWLDGSSEDALKKSFISIATRLPTEEVSADLTGALTNDRIDINLVVQHVLRWLSLPSNCQWLLIIDNIDQDYAAKDRGSQAYDVAEYYPGADHGSILITSRLSNLQPPQNSLRLTKVNREQGFAILQSNAGEIVSENSDAIDELLDRLDGLPLALAQAGSYIAQTQTPVNEYLDYYKKTWERLMEIQDQHWVQNTSSRTVLTTWKISYTQVEHQSQEAANLLKLWAYLDRTDLWYELLACLSDPRYYSYRVKKSRSKVESRYDPYNAEGLQLATTPPTWLLKLTESKLQFRNIMGLLIRYSLVEVNTETESYMMHSVLHTWCYNLSAMIGEQETPRHLAIKIVGEFVPFNDDTDYWRLRRRLLPHGQRVFAEVMKCVQVREATDFQTLHSMDRLGDLLSSQHALEEAESMYRLTLQRKEEATGLGREHPLTLDTVSFLARVYQQQGRLIEAEKTFRRILEHEQLLGSQHELILGVLGCLGPLYTMQRRFAEAESVFQRALDGNQKLYGADGFSTLDIVNDMGNFYFMVGRKEEAQKMYLRSLQGYEKVHGPQHPKTLEAVHNLGALYEIQGRFAESEQMYQQAIDGKERTLGLEHRQTLRTVDSLGNLYARRGKLLLAEKMLGRALEGHEKILGSHHKSTISIAKRFAGLYYVQNRYAEAETMYQRAFEGCQRLLGPSHPDTRALAFSIVSTRLEKEEALQSL